MADKHAAQCISSNAPGSTITLGECDYKECYFGVDVSCFTSEVHLAKPSVNTSGDIGMIHNFRYSQTIRGIK